MRVISGDRKGFKLKSAKGINTRPTEDRVKESIFNMIGDIKNKAKVLDLFSGTGSIGIEFLSRGADLAYFIDNNNKSISIIKENLNHTRYMDNSTIIKTDYIKAIHYFKSNNFKFDYIFLDPPYNENLLVKALTMIDDYKLLNQDGIIIGEYEKGISIKENFISFQKIKERNYGNTSVIILKSSI